MKKSKKLKRLSLRTFLDLCAELGKAGWKREKDCPGISLRKRGIQYGEHPIYAVLRHLGIRKEVNWYETAKIIQALWFLGWVIKDSRTLKIIQESDSLESGRSGFRMWFYKEMKRLIPEGRSRRSNTPIGLVGLPYRRRDG